MSQMAQIVLKTKLIVKVNMFFFMLNCTTDFPLLSILKLVPAIPAITICKSRCIPDLNILYSTFSDIVICSVLCIRIGSGH